MATIHIHRDHQLGLARARKVAWRWAEDVEKEFEMECTVEEGEGADVVTFIRSGVNGRLTVTADRFELDAKLGLLLGAFASTIQTQIEQRLDLLLKASAGKASAVRSGGTKGDAAGVMGSGSKAAAASAKKPPKR